MRRRWLWAFALLAVMIGIGLRFSFGKDIEYKADEQWTFEHAVAHNQPWQWVGMPSSAGLPNPGASVWVFIGLNRLLSADSPVLLARSVQFLNSLALLGWLFFIFKAVARSERTVWLWGLAMAAVNPLHVVLQRKIWAQSTLPLFVLGTIWGWWYRDRKWGAFVWGLVGLLIGQIHLSGFFLAAALALGAWFDKSKPVRWRYFLIGSALGALPFVPWLGHILNNASVSGNLFDPTRITPRFWEFWMTDSLGLTSFYSIGSHFNEWLSEPVLGGRPLYLIGLAHLGLLFIGSLALVAVVRGLIIQIPKWLSRRVVTDQTGRLLGVGLWLFGSLLTLSTWPLYRHYLIVLFPLPFVWLSRTLLKRSRIGPWLLGVVWILELTLTLGLLWFIHQNRGALGADFGPVFNSN